MNLKELADNIDKSVDSMAKKEFIGVPLESADANFLDITEQNIDDAVIIQPIAISYFTACVSAAKRNLERIKFEYELWRKEKYLSIKTNSSVKLTINDIEAKIDVDNKEELLEWRFKIEEAQRYFDNSESMYEGWKQKGYALTQHTKLQNEDYASSGGGSIRSPFPESFDASVRRVKQMIKKGESDVESVPNE